MRDRITARTRFVAGARDARGLRRPAGAGRHATSGAKTLGVRTTAGPHRCRHDRRLAAAAEPGLHRHQSRASSIAALNNGVSSPTSPSNPSNAPKIIYVDGVIDGNVDDANQPLACTDYYRRRLYARGFLADYDPAVWGRVESDRPAGSGARRIAAGAAGAGAHPRRLEHDHRRCRQEGDDSRGVWLDIRGTANVANSRSNIIIRNLTFQDTYDCFPQWVPTDGALGTWNALYDSISLRDANHVWIDHNTFDDRDTRTSTQPTLLRRALPGARRPARHHQRLGPGHGLVEPLPRPRQDHADRLVRQRDRRSRQAARDAASQSVRRHRPARAARALRPGARLQQLLRARATPGAISTAGASASSPRSTPRTISSRRQDQCTPDQFIERFNGTAIFAAGTRSNGTRRRNRDRRRRGVERRERSGSDPVLDSRLDAARRDRVGRGSSGRSCSDARDRLRNGARSARQRAAVARRDVRRHRVEVPVGGNERAGASRPCFG